MSAIANSTALQTYQAIGMQSIVQKESFDSFQAVNAEVNHD
jgi:hypothetical protein